MRRAAVAGTWYPRSPHDLTTAVDGYLASVTRDVPGDLVALIAPHAGLMYSGPVAAHAYRLLNARHFDLAVLVGPSHFVAYDGVAIIASGGFETPFGTMRIDEGCADRLLAASPLVHERPAAHQREHSLEMQMPFLGRLCPTLPIVPLLMGFQSRSTRRALGAALADALRGRRVLLVASTDLSHYHDAATAARLDQVIVDCVGRFDIDALEHALDATPDHACGGGPTVSVMLAAKALGAQQAIVLERADSGDVSGDKTAVVGYMAAALGTFDRPV